MIITALNTFTGRLDLSANQKLQDKSGLEGLPFQLTVVPGQVITVEDKWYNLRSIQSAISSGFITVQPPRPIVHDFIDLGDVPSSYTGQRDRLLKVKTDETGLDFTYRLSVGTVAPTNPSVGDLWVDTN